MKHLASAVAVVARVVVVAVASLGAGCITDRVLTRDDDGRVTVDDDVVDRARLATSTLRGLPFEREVPLEVMSVADLEAWLNRYYDRAKEGLATRDRFFHKLGILPPTRDTASTWKGFVGGFAGGIYDDDRTGPDGQPGTMVLISDYAWWAKVQLDLFGLLTGVDYAYEVFLTHELTHALQDQHLHLDRLIDDAVDDDVRMVQKTILESDANVVGMAHFAGVDLEALAGRTAFFWFLRYNNLLNGPMMQAAAGRTPSFFARQGFSQYELGLGFVEERLNAGDWQRFVGDVDGGAMAELSRSYARVPGSDGALPESTEQLLFPWKRGDNADRPMRLAPLPLDVLDGDDSHGDAEGATVVVKPRFEGLELLDTGVFGALALKHWLEGPLQLGAEPVVDGWGGDRYELLVDDNGETLLFWRVLGDSARDAAQLADAVRDRLRAAHGPDRLDVVEERTDDHASVYRATVRVATEEQRFIRTTRPEHLLVERRGTAVVVVLGLSADEDIFALGDRLFALTVPTVVTVDDDVRRQTVARELDATLTRTIAARPVKAPPSLHDQLVLPARTMAVRVGAEARVVDGAPGDAAITAAGEARWGMRPWLELSLPLSATASARGGPFLVAAGVAPRGLPLLAPVEGLWSGRGLVTAAAARGDLGATVQLEASPSVRFSAMGDATGSVAARVGLLMRPLPGLTLQPGLEWRDGVVGVDVDDGGVSGIGDVVVDGVRLGGVLQRGFVDAPLVEIELVRGLRLTLTTTWTWAKAPPSLRPGLGLTPVEQRYGAGLLLLF